eukprot:924241-Rhodomonas_salina.3
MKRNNTGRDALERTTESIVDSEVDSKGHAELRLQVLAPLTPASQLPLLFGCASHAAAAGGNRHRAPNAPERCSAKLSWCRAGVGRYGDWAGATIQTVLFGTL